MNTLYINDLPMCGGNNKTFCVQDLWLVYCTYIEREIAEGRPVIVLKGQWRLNNRNIPTPTSWFVTI